MEQNEFRLCWRRFAASVPDFVKKILEYLRKKTEGKVEKYIKMIEVTRMNNTKLLINAELIEYVEETPDTMITMTSGHKIIVKESRQEIKNRVILYKAETLNPVRELLNNKEA